ncbi:conserved Plasmodium protein, unknown function [Plasmodium ovale curtisi]|uniref:Uncharacterized protein n=1 Tax=Plasmodium ovale curtisi TaxID=864141 RepID=A0A1A8WKY0_PLAOA|nr:conserved Plasmodium protein, unknown function [Plasmodium ovale curtisi]
MRSTAQHSTTQHTRGQTCEGEHREYGKRKGVTAFEEIMLRGGKLLLLFFILLNEAICKKSRGNHQYNFLGAFNEQLKYRDHIFSPYKYKNKTGGRRLLKHKVGNQLLKYSSKQVHNFCDKIKICNDSKKREKNKRLNGNSNKDNIEKNQGEEENVKNESSSNGEEKLHQVDQIQKKEEIKPNIFDYDVNNELENDIISGKINKQRKEVIKKVKLPIIGTQLKPSGGFTKEILKIINESNDYINVVNEEIIKEKIDNKLKGNDLTFFDTEETLEQHEIKYLKKVYDNNHVLNIYNFLLVWKEKKNIDLSVFVSKITENTNILPGERTVIKFSEIEKVQFLKKIKKNKNVCIAMIFVDNKSKNEDETSINHNLFPIGILAHPLDISLLDKCGEISVLNLYRFKINSYNVTSDDFLVNAQLFIDDKNTLKNFDLTQENKKIIINLYDKILELKIKYNEKIGATHENEKLKLLEKITGRIDEYVNVLNINKSIDFRNNTNLNFYTSLYLEYFSFLPLDLHAKIHTKLQMMYTDDTELRLYNVKEFLMQVYDDLKFRLPTEGINDMESSTSVNRFKIKSIHSDSSNSEV